MKPLFLALGLVLTGCGAAYISPSVPGPAENENVRVIPLTAQSVRIANATPYQPRALPGAFFETTGDVNAVQAQTGRLPSPAFSEQRRPGTVETRLPPPVLGTPYEIGIGDVVVLATRQGGTTVEELSGLLAAQSRRQGYTVQDDGAIAIPDVGRVQIAGLTLEEAEAALFQRLVESQIDPTFSIEIAEFNSKRVSIGGAVRNPTVAPITLTPLFLQEVLAVAGGVVAPDRDFVTIRLYRDGQLYQLPLRDLPRYSIRLQADDSIFVDTDFELEQAQAYFTEQIQLAEFRQTARIQALNELNTEVDLRRAVLEEQRANFQAQVTLDAVPRDYVYLSGEVRQQSRFLLPFGRQATLADAFYDQGGALLETADPSEIYVLRASTDPTRADEIVAWHLDAEDATNFVLATRMELRPNDVIFVAEQPITRWNRVVTQVIPSLITTGVSAAAN
jgi:polysaccharide export outer membrane protein